MEPLVLTGSGLAVLAALALWRRSAAEASRYAARLATVEHIVEEALRDAERAERRAAEAARGLAERANDRNLTSEERDLLLASRCSHCGGAHASACPRVRRIRFRPDGQTPVEVEFWQDGAWDTTRVVWLDDIAENEGMTVIG